jgi:hypothetical protein
MTALPNELLREIVAFLPVEEIVSGDYTSITNVIEKYKFERFMKLKNKRNSLVAEIYALWHRSCICREMLLDVPAGTDVHDNLTFERKDLAEKVFETLADLYELLNLPWPNSACPMQLGVSYQSKSITAYKSNK